MDTTKTSNPFDYAGQTVNNAVLIAVQFPDGVCIFDAPGAHGNIKIMMGDFEFRPREGERMHMLHKGNEYVGAQEGANWTDAWRQQQPGDRMFAAYIGFRFDSLDIIPTSDGSRFLSVKDYFKWSSDSLCSIDEKEGRASWIVQPDLAVIRRVLIDALPMIGVPSADIKLISDEITGKVEMVLSPSANDANKEAR